MKRRRRLARAGLLVLLVFLGCSNAQDPRPNLVLIIADDLGFDDLGFMGQKIVKTPNIDRLASESARFVNAYVPTSVCRPSLATMLTGLYPHQHGIHFNLAPEEEDQAAAEALIQQVPTLPRMLARAGYVSLQTGKFWEGHFRNGGFTHGMTLGEPGALDDHPVLHSFHGPYGDFGLTIGREGLRPIADFLDAHGNEPFFLWFAPLLPHFPFDPPDAYRQLARDPGKNVSAMHYYVMVQWLDGVVGELLDMLEQRHLKEDTLVAFIADNGLLARDFRIHFRERSRRLGPLRSKETSFEAGVRTPLLLRWPGHTRPATIGTPVSSIDLVPTLLAAAGLPGEAAQLPGVNLIPAASGAALAPDRPIFGENYPFHASKLGDPASELTERWVRKGNWKLVDPADPDQPSRLYDLVFDPNETMNRIDHPRAAKSRAELEALLDGWWQPRAR